MNILDGKMIASMLKEEYKNKIQTLEKKPSLAIIHVGDDSAKNIYVRLKCKVCEDLGIPYTEFSYKDTITKEELFLEIDRLNNNDDYSGIIIESPIPKHINILEAFDRIDIKKDVDGLNSLNLGNLAAGHPSYVPATPLGIMKLLKEYKIDIAGKRCVVVGRSNLVGRPMALSLLNADGTVTICHSKTNNLEEITKTADLLIVAIGKPNFIKADMVKAGAIVIDVGINRLVESNKIVGDVDFAEVSKKCDYITPVPGGVGPMTIISLVENLIKSVE